MRADKIFTQHNIGTTDEDSISERPEQDGIPKATIVIAPVTNSRAYSSWPNEYEAVGVDPWKWGTSIARNTTLYASWVPVSEVFFNGYGSSPVYGSYTQYDYYYLHRLNHFPSRGLSSGWNTYGDCISIRPWPYKSSIDHPVPAANIYDFRGSVEEGWTFIGVQYVGEMIYYDDQRYEGDFEFWGYNGDTWDYNQL